jgi:long-chain acyl-CoA synthetase
MGSSFSHYWTLGEADSMSKQKQALYPKIQVNGPFSVEASGCKKVDGETIPRRHPDSKDKLRTTPSEDVKTIFDILKRSADKFGNAKALGTRRVIKTHTESKKVKKTVDGETKEVDKKWTYFELSEYSYISFTEYEKMALAIGSGLRKLGLGPGDRLHLYAATR